MIRKEMLIQVVFPCICIKKPRVDNSVIDQSFYKKETEREQRKQKLNYVYPAKAMAVYFCYLGRVSAITSIICALHLAVRSADTYNISILFIESSVVHIRKV